MLFRRKAFLLYSMMAALLIPLYASARSQAVLLVVGTLVAFFGTGIFSGSGIMGSEIFPTALRARALGFTYNGARTLSSLAPLVIGRIGLPNGFDQGPLLKQVIFELGYANVILAAFNLIPIPPLDGSAVLRLIVIGLSRYGDYSDFPYTLQ